MARIFLAWELGDGFGHLGPLAWLADELRRRGHHLSMAARQPEKAARAFSPSPAPLFQAPVVLRSQAQLHWPTLGFADILHNVGFDDGDNLTVRVRAWHALFEAAGADFVIANHSPTAVLAAYCHGLPACTLGNGFEHPRADEPLPVFPHSLDDASQQRLADTEQAVLRVINSCIASFDRNPLAQASALFALARRHFFTSLPEFDHYGARDGLDYFGVPETQQGAPPAWPPGAHPKVFAYLSHSPGVDVALEKIARLPLRLLVVHHDFPDDIVARLDRPNVRVTRELLDLDRVADDAAMAILNANHATALRLLARGVPAVHAPLQVEQALLSRRLLESGAALSVDHRDASAWTEAVSTMLQAPRFRESAAGFAARYPLTRLAARRTDLVERVAELIAD